MKILCGNAVEQLETLPSDSVHCCMTSPPYYGLRNYQCDGQIGVEQDPGEYVLRLVEAFREVRRVLHRSGTLWLNIGDTTRSKQILGIPWRVAFALQEDGWILRQDIVWSKPSPMPESVQDRCTRSHEYVFLLAKSDKYFYDPEPVAEDSSGVPGMKRNRRSVWTVSSKPYKEAHFATMPPKLAEICIKAGTSERGCCVECLSPWRRVVERTKIVRERPNDYVKRTGEEGTGNSCPNSVAGVSVRTVGWEPTCKCGSTDTVPCTVLDPFAGSGTTLAVAASLGLEGIGVELNPDYVELAKRRVSGSVMLFS